MKELTITIFENSDGELNYDIYNCSASEVDECDSEDGGVCTGTMQDALSMAYDQAQAILLKDAVGF